MDIIFENFKSVFEKVKTDTNQIEYLRDDSKYCENVMKDAAKLVFRMKQKNVEPMELGFIKNYGEDDYILFKNVSGLPSDSIYMRYNNNIITYKYQENEEVILNIDDENSKQKFCDTIYEMFTEPVRKMQESSAKGIEKHKKISENYAKMSEGIEKLLRK
ncbi:MAG: hypothetical protein IKQ61_13365 [Spirochaetales bacterium]|nr:hypothetical protein [Spirochaetales bacterium]